MTNPFYSLLLIISGSVSLTIAGIAWKRRPSAGASALAVTMMSMVFWAWMYALYWFVPGRSEKLLWLSLAFIGVVVSSPAFLVMSAQFSGKTDWPTRRVYALLAILPSFVLLSLWTEPWFDLFSGGVDILDPKNSLQGGLGFGLSALNAYSTTIIAVVFLVRSLKSAHTSRREQIYMILAGTSFPFIAGLISILKLSPLPGLDLTPIAFSVSGICYAYAMFSYKMMDLAPMGRDSVVEEMEDAVLVLDAQDRIIDLNPRALTFVDSGVREPIGKSMKEVFTAWINKTGLNNSTQSGRYRLEVEGHDSRHHDVSITPVVNKKGETAGRTLVWRDVSKQKEIESQLRTVNAQLEYQLNEIKRLHAQLHEQAIRDSLTGLFNRGYLEETLTRELVQANRESYSLCILMIDIDKFKLVNDTYGHLAGDTVLRGFGELLIQNIRANDVPCRYGGDEFVILMPAISIEAALQRAKQLGKQFSELVFRFGGTTYQTTLSIGIAAFPAHEKSVDKLLLAADKAMYLAKNERNKISEYVPELHNSSF